MHTSWWEWVSLLISVEKVNRKDFKIIWFPSKMVTLFMAIEDLFIRNCAWEWIPNSLVRWAAQGRSTGPSEDPTEITWSLPWLRVSCSFSPRPHLLPLLLSLESLISVTVFCSLSYHCSPLCCQPLIAQPHTQPVSPFSLVSSVPSSERYCPLQLPVLYPEGPVWWYHEVGPSGWA